MYNHFDDNTINTKIYKMQNLIIKITQENTNLVADDKIGCFILPDNCAPAFAKEFIVAARKNNKLVLVDGEKAVDFYQKYNPDGVILNTVKEAQPQKIIKQIKKTLPSAIIGVISRNRRHEAMLVSECEPDFIIFKFWRDGLNANKELLDWYCEFFLIQCAAQIEEEFDYSSLNADFIIIEDVKYKNA